jgi:hypothetical protein
MIHGQKNHPRNLLFLFLLALAGWVLIFPLLSTAAPTSVQTGAEGCTFPDMKKGAILLLADKNYYPALSRAIGCAKSEIVMAFYIFSAADRPGNLPSAVIDDLIGAAKRGVAVTVLLERESEAGSSLNRDNRDTAARLKRGGVEVLFDSPRVRTHTKAAVIDGRYVLMGSHNLTNSALKHNHELSVFIDSPELAKETLDYMRGLSQ